MELNMKNIKTLRFNTRRRARRIIEFLISRIKELERDLYQEKAVRSVSIKHTLATWTPWQSKTKEPVEELHNLLKQAKAIMEARRKKDEEKKLG